MTYEQKALQRLIKNVTALPSGCWRWGAALTSDGYGRILFRNKSCTAHRIAYLLIRGEIPENMTLDHLCRVRACVNPYHLEVVTQKVNVLRGTSPSAIHAQVTHCPKGHPYAGVNLYRLPRGNRRCRICVREATRQWEIKNRRTRASTSR